MGGPGFNISCFITRTYLLVANFSEKILQLTIKKQSAFKWNLEVILSGWESYSGAVPLAPHASPRSPIKVWDPDVMVCLYFSPLCKSHIRHNPVSQTILTIGSNRKLSPPISKCDEMCKLSFQVPGSVLRCRSYAKLCKSEDSLSPVVIT